MCHDKKIVEEFRRMILYSIFNLKKIYGYLE